MHTLRVGASETEREREGMGVSIVGGAKGVYSQVDLKLSHRRRRSVNSLDGEGKGGMEEGKVNNKTK